MSVYNNLGDTIEGMAVDCDGRCFRKQGVKIHPDTKKAMTLYTTDRNSHAVVTLKGESPADEKLEKATSHYHRDVGDKVTGDALSIYTDLRAMVKIEVLHGGKSASAQHGIQFASIRKHTIATVKMPLHNLMKKLGFSNNSLTDEKNAD